MAVFETSRALSEGARVNPVSGFARFFGAIMSWNDRRVTRNALLSLSARELEDIGLSQADVARL